MWYNGFCFFPITFLCSGDLVLLSATPFILQLIWCACSSHVHPLCSVSVLKGNGICSFLSLPFWNQCMFHFPVWVYCFQKASFKDRLSVLGVSGLFDVHPALILCAIQSVLRDTCFLKWFLFCVCVYELIFSYRGWENEGKIVWEFGKQKCKVTCISIHPLSLFHIL